MPQLAEFVKDTTTTTGTGSVTLSGTAPTGFRTFAAAFGSGDSHVRYVIRSSDGAEWEVGSGVFNGTTTLTRTTVLSSSNSGGLVNFSAGTKDVYVSVAATDVKSGPHGRTLATARGWAMP